MTECKMFSIESLLAKDKSPLKVINKNVPPCSNDGRDVIQRLPCSNGTSDACDVTQSNSGATSEPRRSPDHNRKLNSGLDKPSQQPDASMDKTINKNTQSESTTALLTGALFNSITGFRTTSLAQHCFKDDRHALVYPPVFHSYTPSLAPVLQSFIGYPNPRHGHDDVTRTGALNLHQRHIAFLQSTSNYNSRKILHQALATGVEKAIDHGTDRAIDFGFGRTHAPLDDINDDGRDDVDSITSLSDHEDDEEHKKVSGAFDTCMGVAGAFTTYMMIAGTYVHHVYSVYRIRTQATSWLIQIKDALIHHHCLNSTNTAQAVAGVQAQTFQNITSPG